MNLFHRMHYLRKRPFPDDAEEEDDVVALLQKRLCLSSPDDAAEPPAVEPPADEPPAADPATSLGKRLRADESESAAAASDEDEIEELLRKHLRLSGDLPESSPVLGEEPEGEGEELCRVGVKMPDGRRVCRRFLKTEPVGLLWLFCESLIKEEDEERHRGFKLVQAIPGAVERVGLVREMSFGDSKLNNSIVSLVWL